MGRALDANGYIAPGAKATIYADGTSTLVTVYSDVDGTTPATNPIVADGDGFWPQRYVTEATKAVVVTSDDVALYTLDPCPTSQGTGAAASAVSFSPTVDLPQTNVQDAIEAAADLAVSGFATYGIGITGNATLLANLDATGTGAGIYRFDGTTTGTFPTGVAAGDTGMIELWRQAGATAMMELHHATSNRVFRRRMTATTWGAWREEINVDQATAEGDIIYRGASDFKRLAKGTAGQVLQMNSGATAPEWVNPPGWTYLTSVATTLGTEFDVTGIPANISDLEILFSGVSLSGTEDLLVQLGTSGGLVVTGYSQTSAAASTGASSTSGFNIIISSAPRLVRGRMTFSRYGGSGDEWFSSHHAAITNTNAVGGGVVSLGGTLDRLRVTRTGTDTFDAGKFIVRYRT